MTRASDRLREESVPARRSAMRWRALLRRSFSGLVFPAIFALLSGCVAGPSAIGTATAALSTGATGSSEPTINLPTMTKTIDVSPAPTETSEPSSTPYDPVAQLRVPGAFAIAWSPSGGPIVVTTKAGLALLSPSDLHQLALVATENPLEYVAFNRDGALLGTTEDGTRWQLWDSKDWQLIEQEQITINGILGVAFDSLDNMYVGTEEAGGTMTIRGFRGTVSVGGLALPEAAEWGHTFAINPSGEGAALNGADGIEMWAFASETSGDKVRDIPSSRASALAYSPDGTTLASFGWDCTASLWGAATGTLIWSSRWCSEPSQGPTRIGVAFSQDGGSLAVASHEGEILVFDVSSGRAEHRISVPPTRSTSVAFDPGGQQLASLGRDGLLHIWQLTP